MVLNNRKTKEEKRCITKEDYINYLINNNMISCFEKDLLEESNRCFCCLFLFLRKFRYQCNEKCPLIWKSESKSVPCLEYRKSFDMMKVYIENGKLLLKIMIIEKHMNMLTKYQI